MKKLKRSDQHAPLQFITTYRVEQCTRRLKAAYPTVQLQRIREDRVTFQLTRLAEGYQIYAEGTLQSWAAGAQTRVTCKIRGSMPDVNPNRNNWDMSWLFGEESQEKKYEKQYYRFRKKISLTYDAIVQLLATPLEDDISQ